MFEIGVDKEVNLVARIPPIPKRSKGGNLNFSVRILLPGKFEEAMVGTSNQSNKWKGHGRLLLGITSISSVGVSYWKLSAVAN